MRIENISSTSIFPRLALILEEDIQLLMKDKMDKQGNKEIFDLLDSLEYAKKKIMLMIPIKDYENYNGASSVPKKQHFTGYTSASLSEADNQVKLLDLLLKVERVQLEMVRSANVEKGIPNDLQEKLKEISSAYQNIVEQLGRSKSSQQLGTINI